MARGFASMSVKRRSEVARRGGLAANAKGVAHKWTSEEARIAGSKSWQKRYPKDSREGLIEDADVL